MVRRLLLYVLLLALAVFSLNVPGAHGATSIRVEGFVCGPYREPIEGASILFWGFDIEAETSTDSQGYFALEASTDESMCTLYAFFDDPMTMGFDLLPASKKVRTTSDLSEQVNFTLVPAATIFVTGRLRPMETTRDVSKFSFEVLNLSDGEVIRLGDYDLIYGTGMNVQNFFLGLDSDTIIVPADTPFVIAVSSSYQYERVRGRWRWSRFKIQTVEKFTRFTMEKEDGFILARGEILNLDIREYSLRSDLDRIKPLMEEVEENLTLIEEMGFYTASERHNVQQAKELIEEAHANLVEAVYERVYIDLRQAYLKLVGVKSRIYSIVSEALASVGVLVAFIATTSVVIATLLTESPLIKLLLSAVLYAPMLFFFYNIYPGCNVVTPGWFAGVSALSGSLVIMVTIILPKFLGRGHHKGVFAKLGAIVTIFSMAKRSLKRRRLRSMFTFSSILVLTMSFVGLTSLSTSYGLIYIRTGLMTPGLSGVMMRMPEYKVSNPYDKGRFYPISPPSIEWATENEGVVNVALKAESTPFLEPYDFINGWPIFGVLGIQIGGDPLMPSIDEAVVEGRFLRDDGTCLIHKSLLQQAGVNLGDEIAIKGVSLEVVGAFNNRILNILDLDGDSFLPKYQINLTPGDEQPMIEAITCEPAAVVITTLNTALQVELVFISRIDLEFQLGVDLEMMGKSMALAREHRFWVSSGGVVYLAHMGSQVGGKGLPILVPWAITILSVVMTIQNSMYERRKEIKILSSIGLNPRYISGVFMAEGIIIGVTAGCGGYILGLGMYPLMAELSITPIIQQKVSAIWCFATIGIAIASVVFGSILALKSSVVLTPSSRRRWTLSDKLTGHHNAWTTALPVKVEKELFEDFLSYVMGTLGRYNDVQNIPFIGSLKTSVENHMGMQTTLISFSYREDRLSFGGNRTTNVLSIIRKPGSDVYSLMLTSRGSKEAADKTGTFMRRIVIRWSSIER